MEQQYLSLEELFIQTQRLMHHYHMIQHKRKQTTFDIRQGQGRILALLKKIDSITQKELAELLAIRPQSLGELLSKLEQNGYIVRKQSKEDKRAMIVEITEKGKKIEFEKTNWNEIFDCLEEQEQQNLKYYLCRISERIEDILQTEQQQKTQQWDREGHFERAEMFREDASRERRGFETRHFGRRGGHC